MKTLLGLVLCVAPLVANAQEFWQFGVYLGDKRIGEHRFDISRDSGSEWVASKASFKATILFVPVYTYEHTAEEQWTNGCLNAIRSSSRANSKRYAVTGNRQSNRLVVDAVINGQQASQTFDGCVRAYAYWDRQRLGRSRSLLNPQTGALEPARLVDMGDRQRLETKAGPIDLWYAKDGHWLGLEVMTPAGKPLTYRLEHSHRSLAAITSGP